MQNPLKKKSTKIIQISYSDNYAARGLGDDGMVYRWSTSNSKWHLDGEVDDQVWEELK